MQRTGVTAKDANHPLRQLALYLKAWRRGKLAAVVAASFVVAFILLAGALTYATGGASSIHWLTLFIPVLLASFLFQLPGGALAGLLAGLVVGPWMPHEVSTGVMQDPSVWLYRSLFLAGIGALTGSMTTFLGSEPATFSGVYGQTLKTFASLAEVRDEPTGEHCERVAHNACAIGEVLGLSKEDLTHLYWAGILHDLGKVVIPAEILLKPGTLTREEYTQVKRHAAKGADLLTSISPEFDRIAAGVRSHHERWDGEGYPYRLAGADIPLFGRILAVVDAFEALTSKRPYRDPLPPEEALAYVKQQSGERFDPEVVGAFENLHREGKIYISLDIEHLMALGASS